ncbi:hypothetical protein SAMN02745136_05172 [Anaerocolumna jejuensis DSM 15929]|uniref:Uncharacterized protein n=1 Tax=Anaerocolumna jejuensis DSM 15929 TaxID=1121322 RepID=A0A1M7BL08_9FIRM|nr:hypothetical protein [Anaerocolumna jejuensis]SHL55651.1 hypothetical protein SAMN02745136_05172 [Anaerocolumna jejuensis DSM 15929]
MDNIAKDKVTEDSKKEVPENNQNQSWKKIISEVNENVQSTEFNTTPFKIIRKIIDTITKLFKAK